VADSQKTLRGPVVVVDDDEIVRTVVVSALEADGFTVITRESGLGLSQVVASVRPTVVILDVSMPGLDGSSAWAVARRAMDPPPIVIFYSSAPRERLQEMVSRFPEARSLPKPTTPRWVVRMVADADLAARRPRFKRSSITPGRPGGGHGQ
jgi:CheY-like chemotaxis protein